MQFGQYWMSHNQSSHLSCWWVFLFNKGFCWLIHELDGLPSIVNNIMLTKKIISKKNFIFWTLIYVFNGLFSIFLNQFELFLKCINYKKCIFLYSLPKIITIEIWSRSPKLHADLVINMSGSNLRIICIFCWKTL